MGLFKGGGRAKSPPFFLVPASLAMRLWDRRVLTLTPAQLKRELRRIAWGQGRLAQKLGVWPSEVRDWLAGKEPLPELVASDIPDLPSHNPRPPPPPSPAPCITSSASTRYVLV